MYIRERERERSDEGRRRRTTTLVAIKIITWSLRVVQIEIR